VENLVDEIIDRLLQNVEVCLLLLTAPTKGRMDLRVHFLLTDNKYITIICSSSRREMGNSAYIVIEIEKNGSSCGGGRVKGRVLLSVQKETLADSLMFAFNGVETSVIKVGKDSTVKDSENIVSSEEILCEFPGGSVAVGQYTFPFEIALPLGLPKTQRCQQGESSYSISYHCEAKLHHGIQIWSIKNSCEVQLNEEPYMSSPTPMYLGPVTRQLTYMEKPTPGTMTLGGKVNLTNVSTNEKLRVAYVIRNDSEKRIKALTVCLVCNVHFRVGGHFRETSYNVTSNRIDVSKLLGVNPQKNIKSGADGSIDYEALLRHLDIGEFGVEIPMDNAHLCTYTGNLGKVMYELVMTLTTTFGTSNSTIRIPIVIHQLTSKWAKPCVGQAYTVPAYWNAQEMPLKELNLSEPAAAVVSAETDDSFEGLTLMLKGCDQWQEISVLKEWLGHSPNNINLLSQDEMFPLFRCLKGDYSIYVFCQTIGEAMSYTDTFASHFPSLHLALLSSFYLSSFHSSFSIFFHSSLPTSVPSSVPSILPPSLDHFIPCSLPLRKVKP
jgi:hypothetical protein